MERLTQLLILFFLTSILVIVECNNVHFTPDRVTLFKRQDIPKEWTHIGEASDKTEIKEFYVALKQQNLDKLERMLYDVSHPRSPLYGKHFTYDQIMEVIAPPKIHQNIVIKWLIRGGVGASSITSRGDALIVNAPIRVIESIFQTEMHVYTHLKSRRRIVAHVGEMSIPSSIAEYVDMVTALSFFPPEKQPSQFEKVKQSNGSPWLIPSQIRKVYNVPETLIATNPKTTQAAVEFEWPGCFSYADLEQFQTSVGFPATNVSRIIPSNGSVDSACDGESALDVQMMSTSGSGAQTWYFANQYWIYEFALTLMGLENPPLVTSLSWGWMEADICQIGGECSLLGINSKTYVNRTNQELMKAGAMGLSVIVCTQDEGAPSDNNNDCSLDDTDTPVWAIYPASSPWVTAVGATTIYSGPSDAENTNGAANPICEQIQCNTGTLEMVAMSSNADTAFTSGGGFSNWTARPAYQDTAVKGYLKGKGIRPPAGTFGINNRGYPDVAAVGSMVYIVEGGQDTWEGGTSASTPIFSGIISLLNDYRLNHGKAPLGFLNYVLYDMAAADALAFNSITVGNNTCTGWFGDICCKYGYSAVEGWNPATGFGTPNFPKMLAYVSNLP